jgi:hypothetical protein
MNNFVLLMTPGEEEELSQHSVWLVEISIDIER